MPNTWWLCACNLQSRRALHEVQFPSIFKQEFIVIIKDVHRLTRAKERVPLPLLFTLPCKMAGQDAEAVSASVPGAIERLDTRPRYSVR